MKRIYSFDVFDTCLTRRFATPSGVHVEVARKVCAVLGIDCTPALVDDFVHARTEAERTARQRSDREEVTLGQIWSVLVQSMGWPDAAKLLDCELAAEEEAILPILEMREKVKAARQLGRVVFASDMYLPAEFIRNLLCRHGFAEEGDGFYVSGEIGKTKASGNLFRHLLQKEGVSAGDITHTGDNAVADFEVPSKLGIRAVLFKGGGLTRAEFALLHSSSDDFWKSSRTAGAMRAFRLENDPTGINELISQFLGPFALGFAAWVLRRAKEDGVQRLYFLSRDCHLIFKVAASLAPEFGNIDCRYLYVSRQALFLPSSKAISAEEMPWMKRFFEVPELNLLLAKLELQYADVEQSLGALAGPAKGAYRLQSDEDWQRFWSALNDNPLRERLLNVMATRREAARQYFQSAGLMDDCPWAIVDLGWYLTCQHSLAKLLKMWGWPGKMRGYYAGLQNRRIKSPDIGTANALIYEKPEDFPKRHKVPTLFSHSTLLEHVVGCADHTTVYRYETDGQNARPICSGEVNEETLKFFRKIHKGVLQFAEANKSLAKDLAVPDYCRTTLEALMADFAARPSERVAGALCGLTASIDQNNLAVRPLVRPFTLRTAILPLWQPRKFADCIWQEGALAASQPVLKNMARFSRRGGNLFQKTIGRLKSGLF